MHKIKYLKSKMPKYLKSKIPEYLKVVSDFSQTNKNSKVVAEFTLQNAIALLVAR